MRSLFYRLQSWRKNMRFAPLLALSVAFLAHGGCAKDYVTSSEGDVIFRIVSINDGDVLESDVITDEGIFADSVDVLVANRPRNPLTTVPQVAMAVFIERYEVSYTRSDGRNTAGVDVPFAISGPLTTTVDVASAGNNVTVPIEVVRLAAKLEPPLRNLRDFGGQDIITVIAQVTLHGRTTAGHAVTDTARVQITFSDFAG